MVETSAPKELDIRDTLDALCDRNRPFEFHYTNTSGDVFVGKSRFLGQDDRYLHLDTPQIVGKQTTLLTGKKLEIYFVIGSETYTFCSKIIKTNCRIQLNFYTTIHGVHIEKPKSIRPGQKRHELRLRFKESDQIPVTVNLTHPDEPSATPLTDVVINGWIEDVSAGGCSLHLDTPRCSDFKFGHPIFVGFTLPDEDKSQIMVQAEVRMVRPPANGYRTRVGVKFQSWPSRGYLTRTIRPLERWIATIQRERLKKRQSKK